MENSIKIHQGAVVCTECDLKGDITIGKNTVVHPKAQIIAEAGPIIIGENNLIEEQAAIVNKFPASQESTGNATVMIIGNNNVFEVDCHSEALKIGDQNVLESKCLVGRKVELTNGCIVGAHCRLVSEECLPENTVIYGDNCSRRQQADRPPPQTLQIDFLTKVLPNYHHLYKPNLKD
ncbi:dynactin subunit 6 [Cloeon dipterum]|uniref:Dynactin subunit 6 n=1 Tax=Cloeon dipterum TaxID=197152 RepID=A0A8S1DHS6_9INSE|nr:Hypothetical predicted protein [Cloeon dipterum]